MKSDTPERRVHIKNLGAEADRQMCSPDLDQAVQLQGEWLSDS